MSTEQMEVYENIVASVSELPFVRSQGKGLGKNGFGINESHDDYKNSQIAEELASFANSVTPENWQSVPSNLTFIPYAWLSIAGVPARKLSQVKCFPSQDRYFIKSEIDVFLAEPKKQAVKQEGERTLEQVEAIAAENDGLVSSSVVAECEEYDISTSAVTGWLNRGWLTEEMNFNTTKGRWFKLSQFQEQYARYIAGELGNRGKVAKGIPVKLVIPFTIEEEQRQALFNAMTTLVTAENVTLIKHKMREEDSEFLAQFHNYAKMIAKEQAKEQQQEEETEEETEEEITEELTA